MLYYEGLPEVSQPASSVDGIHILGRKQVFISSTEGTTLHVTTALGSFSAYLWALVPSTASTQLCFEVATTNNKCSLNTSSTLLAHYS